MDDIYLHQGRYQGKTDKDYNNATFYQIWIKGGDSIIVKKQNDTDKSSRREYKSLNEFFKNWGMVTKDCNNIKL